MDYEKIACLLESVAGDLRVREVNSQQAYLHGRAGRNDEAKCCMDVSTRAHRRIKAAKSELKKWGYNL